MNLVRGTNQGLAPTSNEMYQVPGPKATVPKKLACEHVLKPSPTELSVSMAASRG